MSNKSLDASGTSGLVIDNLSVKSLSPAASTQTLGATAGWHHNQLLLSEQLTDFTQGAGVKAYVFQVRLQEGDNLKFGRILVWCSLHDPPFWPVWHDGTVRRGPKRLGCDGATRGNARRIRHSVKQRSLHRTRGEATACYGSPLAGQSARLRYKRRSGASDLEYRDGVVDGRRVSRARARLRVLGGERTDRSSYCTPRLTKPCS